MHGLEPPHLAAISTLVDFADYWAERGGVPPDVRHAADAIRRMLERSAAGAADPRSVPANAPQPAWDRRTAGPAASDGTRPLRQASDQTRAEHPTAIAESVYGGNETGLPPARVLVLREPGSDGDRFVPAYCLVLVPMRTFVRLPPARSMDDALGALREWWDLFAVLGSTTRAALVAPLMPHVLQELVSVDLARTAVVDGLRQPASMRSIVYLALLAVRRECDAMAEDQAGHASHLAKIADLDHLIATAPWVVDPTQGCVRRELANPSVSGRPAT